jgi:replication initiation and membrane attachment protein
MAMFWQGYGWRCRTHRPLHSMDLLVLTHLYQPIIGTAAVGLYITLCHQIPLHRAGVSEIYPQSYLLKMLALSAKQLTEARHLLEGVGLLNTYEKKDFKNGQFYEFELIPPLTPMKFFQSEVFSLTVYHLLGKERYTELQNMFIQQKPVETIQVNRNITKSFTEVFGKLSPEEMQKAAELQTDQLALWNQGEEEQSEGKYPEWTQDDMSLVKMRLGSQINPSTWNKELESELKEICFLYQLDVWDLIKVLQDPTITKQGVIDIDRLRSFVKSEFQLRSSGPPVARRIDPRQLESSKAEIKELPPPENLTEEERYFKQLATISPLELLSYYHDGTRIADSDVLLVESLIRDYALPHGVVNVLLDYVLQKHDRKLPRSLVQKIAGHWKRLGIKTVEQAREQACKELRNSRQKRQSQKKVEQKAIIPLTKSKPAERSYKAQPFVEPKQMTDEDLVRRQAQIRAKLTLMREQQKRMWREEENTP